LTDALAAVQRGIRSAPADPKPRVFYFQLLCILGEWDKAMTQLKLLPELDPGTILMVKTCAPAIQCETLRKEVFRGTKAPLIFGEPAEWVGWLVHANQMTAANQSDQAQMLRDKALEAAPAVSGKINGQPFEWLADADSRMGPVLEAIIDGRYFWVPLQNVRQIVIDAPTDLRDLVWSPANFVWANQGTAVGLIPTRYVDSDNPADPAACLARKTDWVEQGSLTCGRGQRLFATDQGDFPILETRTIDFDLPAAEAANG
jgi:type VI secretion system protein ImpE